MSEENNNLGDDIKKGAEDAMDSAKEAAKNAADKAGEFAEDAKEAAGKAADKAEEFAEDAKEAAKEFIGEAKETFDELTGDNKKVLAGILGILLGWLGVHKFILGYTKEGIIHIVLSFICGIGWILGVIEGIIYLTKSDAEFYNTYQAGRKPWF